MLTPKPKPKRKRLSAAARDEILRALANLVDSWMDCAASNGIHEDEVTTAVDEAAVNWQYARKREKASRKRGKAGAQ